jgi:hypothetical protein
MMRLSRANWARSVSATLGATLMASALMISGCVQVTAPDKPIEINLNVNIKQEVVVRVQREAEDLVKSNAGGIY